MERLTPRDLKKAANYLAAIHVTGCCPHDLLRSKAQWSLKVLLAYNFASIAEGRVVKPEWLPIIADHPLVRSIEALKAQGFRIDQQKIFEFRRWTLAMGVPMRHKENFRRVSVSIDGEVVQTQDADAK